ncbi:hypothetical protein [Microbacterium indicum]|uniref:hypothetical protein n=1 Tax=Microbacterium indicum TaxID=358100 RepID=UPI000404AA12|nr:hypothetical protein [Microbacterium indicum]
MAHTVFLHVGAPKTGTTAFQERLARNAASLSRAGISVPGAGRRDPAPLGQFHACLDLVGADWAGPGSGVDGAWRRLVEQVHSTRGTAIISHEIFASATSDQAARARRDLTAHGADLHIVYSARDMGRQIAAGWQEEVKQGKEWSFAEYSARLRAGLGFFAVPFDLPRVLGTWGYGIAPDRIHLVTVPRERTADELWLRMCHALRVDPDRAPREAGGSNPSMGAAQTTMMRRLNRRLERSDRPGTYDGLVRVLIAEETLAGAGDPIVPSEEMLDWADERFAAWAAWIRERDIDVVGDVEDLRPVRAPQVADPDRPGPDPQLNAALDALASVVREAEQRARRPGLRDVIRRAARR